MPTYLDPHAGRPAPACLEDADAVLAPLADCGAAMRSKPVASLLVDLRLIRQATLDAAFRANPNRFKNKRPQVSQSD